MAEAELTKEQSLSLAAARLRLQQQRTSKLSQEMTHTQSSQGPVDWKDIGLSMASAVPKAAGNLVGMPQTMMELATKGLDWVGRKTGAENIGGNAAYMVPPEKRQMPWGKYNLGDMTRQGYREMGALHEPQTNLGRYAGAGVEGALSLPTNSANAGYGAASGLMGEGGGDVAGTGGRLGGAAIPLVAQLAASIRKPNATLINEQLRQTSPDQIMLAKMLQSKANAVGSPITGAEALNNPQLLAAQLIAEQQKGGSNIMSEFMRKRGDQAQAAIKPQMEAISPTTSPPSDPRVVGLRTQEAATNIIKDQEGARSAAVRDRYKAAQFDRVPAKDVESVISNIDQLIAADKTGVLSKGGLKEMRDMLVAQKATAGERKVKYEGPGGNIYQDVPGKPQIPVQDIGNLDRARKAMREKVELPPLAAGAIDKESASVVNRQLRDLKASMLRSSVPFKEGKQEFQRLSPYVDELKAGLVGTVAKTENAPAQLAEVLSRTESRVEPIRQMATFLRNRGDTKVLPDLMRLHIENTLDKAMSMNLAAGTETAGAKVNQMLRQTPQLKQNLKAALLELPDGKIRATALDNILDVFEAQGRRLSVGSRTAFNNEIIQELQHGTLVGGVAATAGSPGYAASRFLRDFYDKFRLGVNTKELAQILTDPKSVELMEQLAKTAPESTRAAALVMGMIGTGREVKKGEGK